MEIVVVTLVVSTVALLVIGAITGKVKVTHACCSSTGSQVSRLDFPYASHGVTKTDGRATSWESIT